MTDVEQPKKDMLQNGSVGKDSKENGGDTDISKLELDYDLDKPTRLYTLIESKDWPNAMKHLESAEKSSQTLGLFSSSSSVNKDQLKKEAMTWIVRREKVTSSGDPRKEKPPLRWRILPLHAVLIFKGPVEIVELLLRLYPMGSRCKNDQGMLPLHLGFRHEVSESVVNALLESYPEGMDVLDKKGRSPLALALPRKKKEGATTTSDGSQSGVPPSPGKVNGVNAMRAYAAAMSIEHTRQVQEQHRKEYEREMSNMKEEYRNVVNEIEARSLENVAAAEDKVNILKEDLSRVMFEASRLREMVSTLEEQIRMKDSTTSQLEGRVKDLESDLKEKIGNYEKQIESKDTVIKDVSSTKSLLETQKAELIVEKQKLIETNDQNEIGLENIATQITTLSSANLEINEKNKLLTSRLANTSNELNDCRTTIDTVVPGMQKELALVKSECSDAHKELNRKETIESTLLGQVNSLAEKLAEAATAKNMALASNQGQVREYKQENIVLKKNIEILTSKFSSLSSSMKKISDEQEQLLESSANHERTILSIRESDELIREATARQAIEVEQAEVHRNRLMEAYKLEEKHMKASLRARQSIIEALDKNRTIQNQSDLERDQMFASCAKQKEAIEAAFFYLDSAMG